MKSKRASTRRLCVEQLERRLALSLIFGLDQAASALSGDALAAESHADAKGAPATAPPIRLDLVALHELGHSLGLAHATDPNSIMYPYYNANYNLSNFAGDSSVPALQSLYSNVNTSAWKDSLDPSPGDGIVEVTYSFVPDGTQMDKGTSTLFTTFNKLFSSPSTWEPVFVSQLNRWASVSGGKLEFLAFNRSSIDTNPDNKDTGLRFNYSGSAQNDPRSGDIRIAAHRFDGAGKTLAHTYYPPPNGSTAAGDSHYDQAENWLLGSSGAAALGSSPGVSPSGSDALADSRGIGTSLAFAEMGDAEQEAVVAAVVSADGSLPDSSQPASTTDNPAQAASCFDDGGLLENPSPVLVFSSAGTYTTGTTDHAVSSSAPKQDHDATDRVLASPDALDLPSALEWHPLGLGRPGKGISALV